VDDAQVRTLRRKCIRLLSEISVAHDEGMNLLLAEDEGRRAVKLISGMVMLVGVELPEPTRQPSAVIPHPSLTLVTETLHLLVIFAQHLQDITPHVAPVRHLFISITTRLTGGARIHPRLRHLHEHASLLRHMLGDEVELADRQAENLQRSKS